MEEKVRPIIPFFWMYLLVGILGGTVSGMLVYSYATGARMNTRYTSQLIASKDIRLNITTAHLWFEEILSNDKHESMDKVWAYLDQAKQEAKALSVAESGAESFFPFNNPKIRKKTLRLQEKLQDFKRVAQKRFSEKETSHSGSDIDQRHDAIFMDFTRQAEGIEIEIQRTLEEALVRFKLIHMLLIASCVLLFTLGWLAIRRFQLLQTKHFQMLQTNNQLLRKEVAERKKAEEETKISRKKLRDLNTRLQYIREEEKAILAREMHDELGHSLSVINLDLVWIKNRLPENTEPVKDKIDSMFLFIESIVQTIQRIVTELRPEILDAYGLLEALKWQATQFQNRTGIQCELSCPDHINLDPSRSTMFFRIYQESLTNIVRHAKASKVCAHFRINKNGLELTVEDNGIGIEKEQILGEKSLGLMGMRERALTWGGKVTFRGEKGKGTTISVNIPTVNHEKRPQQDN